MADASPHRNIEALPTAYLPHREGLAPFKNLPVELGKSQLFGVLSIVPIALILFRRAKKRRCA